MRRVVIVILKVLDSNTNSRRNNFKTLEPHLNKNLIKFTIEITWYNITNFSYLQICKTKRNIYIQDKGHLIHA